VPPVTYRTGEGLLYHAFMGRGWLGPEIESGKWAVACPWEAAHTKGQTYDSSTVLWAPGPGEAVGWWHCSHSHCQGRDLRDVLAVFSRAELDRASEAAGIADRHTPPKRDPRYVWGARYRLGGAHVR
jgi:hypothetical protein